MTPRKRAYIETYGCQMNVSDGELMEGILTRGGYDIAQRPEDADVIIVNTCAIRDHAEQRVVGRVGDLYRLKRDRPDIVIGVTGCMAQRLGERMLEQVPHLDLVMGPDSYRGLPDALAKLRPATLPGGAVASVTAEATSHTRRTLPVLGEAAAKAPRLAMLDFVAEENYEGLEQRRASTVTAWVPVQRGCNYRCTYCIVPYVRGSEKNRAPSHIIDEVRGLAAKGLTEVVLLGQTVNSYEAEDWDFARLLRAVARVDGIRRVRFTSPHPNDMTQALIDVMAEEPAVCKQLHLPAQSGHDRTLKRMLRRYTVAQYLDIIRRVREAMPGIALSTDIIVGFPGETDEEYEATLDLMREVRFDDAFMYKYSLREGTPATRLPLSQHVAPEVAQQRLERLIDLHREIQLEINTAELGRVEEVLVERVAKSAGDVLGRTDSFKVIAFPGDPSSIGSYMHVRTTQTSGATFRGAALPASPAHRVA
ncbi:MAG TPA: MiaB/RimO family radical SAM methylthiotransferase [Longimicrobiales bacterium]